MMNVQFLEENHKRKFAILPYNDFLRFMELVSDEEDYIEGLKVLKNKWDKVLDYNSDLVLENPIEKERKKRGLTQAELAKHLGVDPSYISKIEKPGFIPSEKVLANIARALGCRVEILE